jgi:aminoglycoside phosphotransferase (APT) family kinase protein
MLNTPYIAESLEDDEKETIKKHVQNLSVSNPDPKHIDEARGFLGAMAQEFARGVKESFEKVLEEEPDLNKRNEARQRLGDVLAHLDDIAEGASSRAANGSSGTGGTTEQNKVLQEIEKQTQMAKEVAATEEIFGLVQAFMSLTKKGREYSLQLI